MDQFIAKPLKRFLYNSKEFKKKCINNLNSVQYSVSLDEAVINMTDIKSIMKPTHMLETNLDTMTTKQITKNNVLFNDTIMQTLLDDSINNNEDNNNTMQLVKIKVIEEAIKEIPKVLNLSENEESGAFLQENLDDNFDGIIENVAKQPGVIKIKVKVINKNEVVVENIENDLNSSNDSISDIISDNGTEEIVENISENILNNTEDENSNKLNETFIVNGDKSNSFNQILIEETIYSISPSKLIEETNDSISTPILTEETNESISTPILTEKTNDSISMPISEMKSIEDFQNLTINETKHNVSNTCIFDENKSRPLSPIPALSPPKNKNFRTVDNLIDFHERQVHKIVGKSPPKTLPRMGTSSLNRSSSKTKLNDSEIISALVRDRFIVNLYENRSFRRNYVKKPSTYGRIYRTIERNVNLKNDSITKQNLLNNDIVTIKQSSPIKFSDQLVSLKSTPFKKPEVEELNSSTSTVDQICEDIKNISIPEEPEVLETKQINVNQQSGIYQQSSEYGSGSTSTISLDQQLQNVPETEDNTFSEVSSYNMDEFLKKALGDELNNLDNTEVEPKENLAEKNEESITTSHASDLISKINTFQSNFYRSFTRKLQHVTDTLRMPPQKVQDKQSVKSDLDSLFSNNEEVTALLRQAAVQYEALKQISKALTLCRNSKEFCVSSEQVEGERLLLVATHKRQAILDEIRRLEYSPELPSPPAETGNLTITNISLPLKPASVDASKGRELSKWYVVVVSSGLQITATVPTLAAADGNVKFREEMTFKQLPTQFEVNVEVFCLLQRKLGRNFSHESKYHINKDTKRSHCPTPKKFLSREKSSQKIPARYDTGIRTTSFKLCGSLKLTVEDLSKPGPWELRGKIPFSCSLSGSVSLNLSSSLVDIPVKYSGFLTVGSESGGFALWNRRWCVLDGHLLKYWNYPSEEENTDAFKQIDLKYCVSSTVQVANRSLCAKPRTLLIEIARKPKPEDSNSLMMACTGSYTIERHYLSADNNTELNEWQEQLDKVVQALRIWNVGFLS